ncbi:MAG: hypothetical protein OHK005_01600 [Candidatus Methylacidiphilales bacterium]
MKPSDRIEFTLNGQRIQAVGISPNTTLLNWLRAAQWTGTKEGCAEGDCGACTVAVMDATPTGERVYRTLNSCIALLPTLDGREVWTVEGIATHGPHPVQRAMADHYGSQCGYCTPGFVTSLFEGYYRNDITTLADLNDALNGNLCRCTGYRPIRDAARSAWTSQAQEDPSPDPFAQRLATASVPDSETAFCLGQERFFQPTSLPAFFDLWRAFPDATLIAGGTEIGVLVAKSFKRFPVFIGLQRIKELLEIRESPQALTLGGGVTLTDAMPYLKDSFPSLYEMCRWFASRPIRNRATFGGNLATASPIGDTAPVLISLGTSLLLSSFEGEREIPLRDFFTGYRRTVLQPGELIRALRIPKPSSARRLARSFKVSKRREMDISIVSAGFCVDFDTNGTITHAGLAFGGVAPTPATVPEAETFLLGKTLTPDVADSVAAILQRSFHPITDGRGTREYRQAVAVELWRGFVAEPEPSHQALPLDALPPPPCLACPRHESASKHADGSALYVDDLAERRDTLHVWPVVSPHARATILRRDATQARTVPGVVAVLMAEDVPGLNDTGAVRHDEPLLAKDHVEFAGQIVAVVVGETPEACRVGAAAVQIDYAPLTPVLTIEQAIAQGWFHTEPNILKRGDTTSASESGVVRFTGQFTFGGQEHFYLETQAAWAEKVEDDLLMVHSSTQHPSEAQAIVAHVLGVDRNRIIVQSPRMGGGFGGKETQGAIPAALAALATHRIGKPCRVRWNRDQDFMITGKRHPFLAQFRVAADSEGRIRSLEVDLYSNGGWSLDLSGPICDRALFHLDNVYYLPNVRFCGRVCKTNLPSNTAFRGFGGPQGMLVIEEIMDRVARRLGLSPETVRERNLYHRSGETNTTHYGQEIGDNRLRDIWFRLKETSRFLERRQAVDAFNQTHSERKRGLAITGVKFGISFTHTPYNQAGALVLIYTDGSVQVNHGGTEMGQGLYTKIQGVAARELGIPIESIRITQTRTDKIPNTSATAASSGSDLNGAAVREACRQLLSHLRPVAAQLLSDASAQADPDRLVFQNGRVEDPSLHGRSVPFTELVQAAYLQRIPLAAFGYYRTPEIHYDRAAGRGRPFYYFACGAAVSEVEIEVRTGQVRLIRTDILHDVGSSLNEGIDRGQIEGGFIQGLGWLTSEELVWNDQGHLLSHGASTYQIPTIGDVPTEFHIELLANAAQPGTIHGSKAVGEPPLMLAISVREAIRDAIASAFQSKEEVLLASPATPEAVFRAYHRLPPSAAPSRLTW